MQPPGEITIDATFNGPPASGNGGYAAGLLAGYSSSPLIVRVLAPIPLGTPLSVSRAGEITEALHGDKRILSARPGTVTLTPPAPPTLAAARDAASRPTSFGAGGPSTCFVCGRNRAPGEGLHIHCGRLGNTYAASVWTPHPNVCGPDGFVRPEYVWAALDCPGGFALPASDTTYLLGEMSAAIHQPIPIQAPVIVHAWHVWSDGRKHFAGTALHDADGALLAQADTLWIELTPAQAKGLAP
jgi:hypothetical protein